MLYRSLIAILLLCALQGCATSVVYNYRAGEYQAARQISVKDERPVSDKTAEIMSMNIASDDYGVYRLGDGQVSPDRMLYLQRRLGASGLPAFDGQLISVLRFEIRNNQQAVLRKTALLGGAGVLMGQWSGPKPPNAAIVTTLQVRLGAETYESKHMTPYLFGKPEGIVSSDEIGEVVKSSMDAAIDDLLKAIAHR